MSVFFTSDLHIGHRLVARHRGEPLGITDADDEQIVRWHDLALAQNWDATVTPADQVWVLGDISAGGSKSQTNALAWVANRPGEKHLIAGNHDGCHSMNRDAHKWLARYLAVFASVQVFARRNIPLSGQRKRAVLLSHFPYEGEGGRPGGDRYTQYRLRDEGLPLLHGHTHCDVRATHTRQRNFVDKSSFLWEYVPPELYAPAMQIHVGPDAWGLAPVSLEQIAEMIEESDAKHDTPSLG